MLWRYNLQNNSHVAKQIFKYAYIVLIICWVIAFSPSSARAFTVSPGRIEITLPDGEKYEGSYTVGNPSDTPIRIKVTVEEWFAGQDKEAIKGEWPSLEWVKLSPQELDLRPNETSVINCTVSLPKEAKGEYAAMIYFGSVPDPSKKGIQMRGSIGNALYVIVKGTEVIKGELNNITITNIDPLEIRVEIRNLGNIHIRPAGKITVRKKGLLVNEEGRELIEIPFNKGEEPVFPKMECVFLSRSDAKLKPDRYELEFNIQFDKEMLTKELDFTVDKDGRTQILDKDSE